MWQVIVTGLGSLVLWFLTLLPVGGCGLLNWESINLGWVSYYLDLTLVGSVLGTMIAVEVGERAFRVAYWAWKTIVP